MEIKFTSASLFQLVAFVIAGEAEADQDVSSSSGSRYESNYNTYSGRREAYREVRQKIEKLLSLPDGTLAP